MVISLSSCLPISYSCGTKFNHSKTLLTKSKSPFSKSLSFTTPHQRFLPSKQKDLSLNKSLYLGNYSRDCFKCNFSGGFDFGGFEGPQSVIEAIAVLTAIIVVHESGHFLAAYLQGIHGCQKKRFCLSEHRSGGLSAHRAEDRSSTEPVIQGSQLVLVSLKLHSHRSSSRLSFLSP